MTNGPPRRGTKRTFGPPSPCSCDRFFQGTIDSPAFWSFDFSTPQTHPQWTWLNDFNWMESWPTGQLTCEWRIKYGTDFDTHDMVLQFIDNPGYEPHHLQPPFRLILLVRSLTNDYSSQWLYSFDFGDNGGFFINAEFFLNSADWVRDGNSTPNAVRPIGRLDWRTRECEPDWAPGHDPT